MMVGCCDARNLSSLCIVAKLCITLRYARSLLRNSSLTFFLRNGMDLFLKNLPLKMQAFAFSLDKEVQSASLQHQDPSNSLSSMFQVFIMLRFISIIHCHC